jgi:UDP-N-acetylmuramate dehydrogenase
VDGRLKNWPKDYLSKVACQARINEPLSDYTTLGIGGAAELLVWARNEKELSESLRYFDQHGIGWRVLGKGSNILVSDQGVSGAVVKIADQMASLRCLEQGRRKIVVEVGGGYSLSKLINWATRHNAAGLESLWGIPATVGGAIKMNAATKTGAICDRLLEVRLYSRGRFAWVSKDSLKFGYRKSGLGPRRVVVAARFELARQEADQIKKRIETLRLQRQATQPRGVKSAGCFFRNPESDSAGRLIDRAGCKGLRVGQAFISKAHANFIVHRGGARAADVWVLSKQVAQEVKKNQGVSLRPEVELWGDFKTLTKTTSRRKAS